MAKPDPSRKQHILVGLQKLTKAGVTPKEAKGLLYAYQCGIEGRKKPPYIERLDQSMYEKGRKEFLKNKKDTKPHPALPSEPAKKRMGEAPPPAVVHKRSEG